MERDDEIRQLEAMFRQLGAEANQARVMARQLSRRAGQMAEREGIDHLDALKRLLELVRSGREGKAYEP